MRMLGVEKDNARLEKEAKELQRPMTFKSHEYLHAIGMKSASGGKMPSAAANSSNLGSRQPSRRQIED